MTEGGSAKSFRKRKKAIEDQLSSFEDMAVVGLNLETQGGNLSHGRKYWW